MTIHQLKQKAGIVGILSIVLTTALADAPPARADGSGQLIGVPCSAASLVTTWMNATAERSPQKQAAGFIVGGLTVGVGIALVNADSNMDHGVGWAAIGTGTASILSSTISLWKGRDADEHDLSVGLGWAGIAGDAAPALVLEKRF